jgi:demethylspheroidene O-methyltransferase
VFELRRHWHSVRDRLLGQPEFRRRVAAFPLTRWIARRRAQSLFDLVAGFVYSQALLAAVQLNLFEILSHGPRSAESLAATSDIALDPMRRLLDACVALQLIEPRAAGHFGLGSLGAALVNNPGLTAMIEHHQALYSDLAEPLALLRGPQSTALSRYWAYSNRSDPKTLDDQKVGTYSRLMAVSQSLVADQILDAYSMRSHHHLMDVGGGHGSFLESAARCWPELNLTLFDLPAVVAGITQPGDDQSRIGVNSRIRAIAGNFFVDPLPLGADLISLVRVLHDHDDAAARRLLSALYNALPAGGTVLIAEPMSGGRGAQRMGDAYFGFYFLAMKQGQVRSQTHITSLLSDAGFVGIRLIPTALPLQTSLIIGQRRA